MGWFYIIADLLIATAYFAIPASIFIFYWRRREALYFPKLYWLFAAFILSCGVGHLINATLFWHPWYRLSGLANAVTAAVSWGTVFALVRYLPQAVKMPGALELARQLQAQVDEQRETEKKLRLSETLFRTLADHLPLIIFAADAKGRVDFLNQSFYRFAGDSAQAPPDALLRRAIHQEDLDHLVRLWREGHFGGSHMEGECRLMNLSGEFRPFMFKAVSVEVGAIRWVGFAVDISRQKEEADQQLVLERQIQETQKLESLGVLAGGIAHDFNNLLTGMLGSAAMAQMDLPEGHPAQVHLKQIETTSLRAADLCRQMLAYSGKGRFVITQIDMSKLIEETTYLIQSSISKKAVIRFNLGHDLPPCEGDASQLRQVVMNLVINASDAIGDRSGFITLNTGVTRVDTDYLANTFGAPGLAAGDYVFIEVSDTGCGMSQDILSRIFDPFFTTKFSGRGLGLAAVLGIIKGHKGAIRVYSEAGRGTTFKMLIPTCTPKLDQQNSVQEPLPVWSGEGKVLLVDDEETIRSMVGRLFERWGFTCLMAIDGRDAVEKFRIHGASIRLVLMDLTMPHMDGEEAFRSMRTLNPGVAVILMSGYNEQEAINRFTGKGLAGFVQKPFLPKQLEEIVRKVLADRSGG
ncbi:MAG: response regulator [Candidatus Methylacidiphilales bacterium]|nr:response regulator [Candidatus Methylacidiphilales bacterium]